MGMKPRFANMELLRIVSMLFILILHANGSLGVPDLNNCYFTATFRVFIESLAIIAVNIFVCLSGWFGLRFSIAKLSSLLFQVFFYSILCFCLFCTISPDKTLTLEGIKSIFLFNGDDLWFVKSYLTLYILSPFLNSFIKTASKKEFEVLLIVWGGMQFIYGWFQDASISFAMNGTTGLSFAFLYLLTRYVKIYKYDEKANNSVLKYFITYVSIALITTMMVVIYFMLSGDMLWVGNSRLWSYANPLFIVSALIVVLLFTNLKIRSKFINWISISSFSVYIVHCNTFVYPYYGKTIKLIAEYSDDYTFLSVFAFIILVFVACILIDKIRIYIWDKIHSRFQLYEV